VQFSSFSGLYDTHSGQHQKFWQFGRRNATALYLLSDRAASASAMSNVSSSNYAFYRSSTFERGALLAANLGDDADTTTAVFGQLAGAFYGAEAIPEFWLERLAMRD
jgi:ADP-ribosylglycohydrolase